jgi:hypothetical protein
MAQPLSANPFPLALLSALAAVFVATGGTPTRRTLVGASLLTAVAAAFRLDFAIYAGAGVVAALAAGRQWRSAGAYVGAAAGLTLLVYLPFLVAVGPGDLYDALVGVSLRQRDYWTLPFPLHYRGGLSGLRDLKDLLDFYVPALLVAGLVVAVVALVVRALRERALPPSWVGLTVFGIGGFSYLTSRTDPLHTTPLLVALAALLPLVLAWAPRRLAPVAGALFVLLLVHGAWNRASALLRPPQLARVHVAVADGAEAPPSEARAVDAMVAAVQGRVPPGQPIYVVSRRTDLVRFNDPLVYVLTERENPTHHDVGLDARAPAQAAIVSTLRRVRPRVVVRWTDPISAVPEPNLRGRPTGVHTLDRFIAANYRLAVRAGHYDVLVPR